MQKSRTYVSAHASGQETYRDRIIPGIPGNGLIHVQEFSTCENLLCIGAQTSPSTWIAWPCCVLPENCIQDKSKEFTKSDQSLGDLQGLPMSMCIWDASEFLQLVHLWHKIFDPVIQTKGSQFKNGIRIVHIMCTCTVPIHPHKVSFFHVISTLFQTCFHQVLDWGMENFVWLLPLTIQICATKATSVVATSNRRQKMI